MLLTLKFKWGYTMNSFQKQFNSLLGLALGAQKLGGETEKVLETPSAPTPSKTPTEEYNIPTNYEASTLTNKEYAMANLGKERSLQNLRNRHEALRAIKRERLAKKGELTFGGKL